MRIILSILVINALLIRSIGWAEEPQTPSSAQTPAAAGESASPSSNEQPASQPTDAAPAAPAPAPTTPTTPAPPSGMPATETTTEQSAQQAPEHAQEEKEKKTDQAAPPPSNEQPASQPTDAAPTPAPAPAAPAEPVSPSGTQPTEAAPTPAPTGPAEPASPSGTQPTEAAPEAAPAPTGPAEPASPSGTQPTEAAPTPAPTGPAEPVSPSGTQPTEAAPEAAPAPATKEKSAEQTLEQTQQEKEKKKIETTLTETSLIKGRLQLEFIETYVHTSSNQLFIEGLGLLPVLILGPIEVQKIRRDIFSTTFVVRYKVTPKIQASLNVPYQFAFTRISAATGTSAPGIVNPTTETTSSSTGLGDINGALTYQVLNEGLVRPTVTVALGFKGRTGQDVFESDTPTGSGYNSVSFAVSASKTSDPAVLFGSLSYAYAIPRNNVLYTPPNGQPPTLIDFEPGDNIGVGFGIAYALNYKLTLNLSFNESINLPSKINHNRLSNSLTNAASLRFGGTWRVNDKTSIDLSVAPGFTADAADFIVALRIPWRF